MSIRPGVTYLPAASIVRSALPRFAPIPATFPSRRRRSAARLVAADGSSRVPFWISSEDISETASNARLGNQVQHRHPHRQPVGHLRQDSALRAVSDVGLDFDAAVHGAGVHDENVFLAALKAVPGQTEEPGEFADGGELAGLDPLELDAEHVDDVDLAD